MSKTYNGWTNYATWRVNLELFQDYDSEDWAEVDQSDLAEILKERANDMLDNQATGYALDYARAFLEDVNWYEIAVSVLDLEH